MHWQHGHNGIIILAAMGALLIRCTRNSSWNSPRLFREQDTSRHTFPGHPECPGNCQREQNHPGQHRLSGKWMHCYKMISVTFSLRVLLQHTESRQHLQNMKVARNPAGHEQACRFKQPNPGRPMVSSHSSARSVAKFRASEFEHLPYGCIRA